jgi:outer membrane lipoprotein-sorting protein
MRLARILLTVVLSLLPTAAALAKVADADNPPPPPEEAPVGEKLPALIERVRWENARLATLRAEFRQLKESSMLMEAEEARGMLSYEAPERVRWEYLEPNPISLLIEGGTMTTWYRDLDRVEQVDIGKKSQKILRYLGAANSIETLLEYFTVRLSMPDEPGDPYVLDLVPRYEQVAKKLAGMSVHIDPESFLPVYLRYVEPDGDETTYRFERLEINGELEPGTFDLQLPDSVEVRVLSAEGGAGVR